MRFRLELRTDKTGADGAAPIYLRITHRRRLWRIATDVRIPPDAWNDRKQEVRRNHPLARAINARLKDLLIEAQRLALEHPNDPEAVRTALKGARGDVLAFVYQHAEALRCQGAYWEFRKYFTLAQKLETCFGRALEWRDLDATALERFARFLATELGNGPSTVAKELQRLHRIVRLAIRRGELEAGQDPFLRYDPPKAARPFRRKLTLEELRRIETLELPDDSLLALYRDVFLFAIYAGGMRFGDVCTLRRDVNLDPDGWLRYDMMKTGARVELPLPPPALQIVRRWERARPPFVFPLLEPGDDANPLRLRRRIASKNAIANRYIKKVCRLAGIARPEEVSMHVARHTFADLSRRASGDVFAVSRALGHRDLATTQRYLSELDRDAVARLIETVWGHGNAD